MKEELGTGLSVSLDGGKSGLQREDKPIAFDIETFEFKEKEQLIQKMVDKAGEGYVKPETIKKYQEEALSKLALSPLTGQVILTGFFDGENFTQFHSMSEKELLEQTFAQMEKYLLDGYRIISKGAKRFDLPFMLFRGGYHKLKFDFPYSWHELTSKYKSFYHLDLENVFDRFKLGIGGYAMGVVDYIEKEGNEIHDMYVKGDMEGIIGKNSADLATIYLMYERLKWANL